MPVFPAQAVRCRCPPRHLCAASRASNFPHILFRVVFDSPITNPSLSLSSLLAQYWTSRLQVSSPLSLWQPWSMNGQLAGFETVYPNDFRFVTVRGAGHMYA